MQKCKCKCDILGDFQTLCQGLQEYFSNETFRQRKVTGCGKNRGFQLVLDAQRIQSLLPKNHLTRGFKVFVTIPGVITSKVPFWADPTFRGEHNFYIHGIHVIKVHNLCASFFEQFHFFVVLQNISLKIIVNYHFFIIVAFSYQKQNSKYQACPCCREVWFVLLSID